MYIVSLVYKKDLKEVAEVREDHLKWVKEQIDKNIFIAAGPKKPLTGGVILVKSIPRVELDDLLATDPFQKVADYIVIEVELRSVAAEFNSLVGI